MLDARHVITREVTSWVTTWVETTRGVASKELKRLDTLHKKQLCARVLGAMCGAWLPKQAATLRRRRHTHRPSTQERAELGAVDRNECSGIEIPVRRFLASRQVWDNKAQPRQTGIPQYMSCWMCSGVCVGSVQTLQLGGFSAVWKFQTDPLKSGRVVLKRKTGPVKWQP